MSKCLSDPNAVVTKGILYLRTLLKCLQNLRNAWDNLRRKQQNAFKTEIEIEPERSEPTSSTVYQSIRVTEMRLSYNHQHIIELNGVILL